MRTSLINYGLYQAGWFACVLGAAAHRPWTGCLIAVTLVGVHLMLSVDRRVEARVLILAIGLGAVMESLHIALGTYRVTSGTVIAALPPPWLLALWAQLATTFRFSLRAVMTRPIRAAVFGAVGGPLAFLAGERLGALALLPPLAIGLIHLSISWTIALTVLSVACTPSHSRGMPA